MNVNTTNWPLLYDHITILCNIETTFIHTWLTHPFLPSNFPSRTANPLKARIKAHTQKKIPIFQIFSPFQHPLLRGLKSRCQSKSRFLSISSRVISFAFFSSSRREFFSHCYLPTFFPLPLSIFLWARVLFWIEDFLFFPFPNSLPFSTYVCEAFFYFLFSQCATPPPPLLCVCKGRAVKFG